MNKIWKKIIAAVCIMAMFVSSIQILPASIADARGSEVESIVLTTSTGIEWYIDGLSLKEYVDYFTSESAGPDEWITDSGYLLGKQGDNYIIKPTDTHKFPNFLDLYASVPGGTPKASVMSDGNKPGTINVSLSTDGSYRIRFALLAAKGNLTATLTPQYKVTFPY